MALGRPGEPPYWKTSGVFDDQAAVRSTALAVLAMLWPAIEPALIALVR